MLGKASKCVSGGEKKQYTSVLSMKWDKNYNFLCNLKYFGTELKLFIFGWRNWLNFISNYLINKMICLMCMYYIFNLKTLSYSDCSLPPVYTQIYPKHNFYTTNLWRLTNPKLPFEMTNFLRLI